MNLPIKVVDLVTLLFLSLLVVIIIFIILQRNIKRFKLRNVKDPHFLACKSVPKELKDAILRKHAVSHAYSEPETLLTTNYQHLNDETKTFLRRIKAFETSKNLESALTEYGHRRPISFKFEDFIDSLINSKDDTLPKDLLRDFYKLYLWAMLDPMKFENEQLQSLNKLINRIIQQLALNRKPQYDQIIQHKLDLNSSGDYDFNKKFNSTQSGKSKSNKEKSIKFGPNNTNNNNNSADQPSSSSYTTNRDSFKNLNEENQANTKSKLKKQAGKLAKSVFTKKPQDLSENLPFNSHTNTKKEVKMKNNKKYEEIKDASFESQNSNTIKESKLTYEPESPDMDTTNRWSGVNDSIKAYDSENEEIPLVVRTKESKHQKKQSSSAVMPAPQTSTNASTRLKPSSAANDQTELRNLANSKVLSKENKGFQT